MNTTKTIPYRLYFSSKTWVPFSILYEKDKELFSHLDTKTIHSLQNEKVAWGYETNKNRKMVPQSTQNRYILLEKENRYLMTKSSLSMLKSEIIGNCYFQIKKWGKKKTLLLGWLEYGNGQYQEIHQIILHPCDYDKIYFHAFNELFFIIRSLQITHISFHVSSGFAFLTFHDKLKTRVPPGFSQAYLTLHNNKKRFKECQVFSEIPSAKQKPLNKQLNEVLQTKRSLFAKNKKPKALTNHSPFKWMVMKEIKKCPHTVDYIVWTDASVRNKKEIGVASYIIRNREGKLVQKKAKPIYGISVFRGEFEALFFAFEYLKLNNLNNVLFLTDSSGIETYFNKQSSNVKHEDLLSELRRGLSFIPSSTVQWIPRKENKEADKLCRKAYKFIEPLKFAMSN